MPAKQLAEQKKTNDLLEEGNNIAREKEPVTGV